MPEGFESWATVADVDRRFSLLEAREMLPDVIGTARQIIPLRAELATAMHGQRHGGAANVADLKAMEARLSDLLDQLAGRGLEVKGWAPLLLDFPAVVSGQKVLLCWLEGDRDLEWYHEPELGFAGRRPLAELEG